LNVLISAEIIGEKQREREEKTNSENELSVTPR
jgi:hypothetical protein